MTPHLQDAPLLAVALIVFGAVFIYLWRLDSRLRGLEFELRDELAFGAPGERADADGAGKYRNS